jgi:hypothetical protein
MDNWQLVWRRGFVPFLSTAGLLALKRALETDAPILLQGSTTDPPPLQIHDDWPVEGACALALCGWLGDGLATVGEVETYFAEMCWRADQALGEPAACRYFLTWFDDTPRAAMRERLLAEVKRALVHRGQELDAAARTQRS